MAFFDLVTINGAISPISLTLIVCVLTWVAWSRKPDKSPPGTNGIPFLGVLLSLGIKFPERVMQKWATQYGPLYMVKFGLTDVVVISSPEIAYEAFAKHTCFNDRPQSMPAHSGSGLIMMNSSDFTKEQRRFGLNTLRNFGMGRRSLEPKLWEISNELCETLDKYCGSDRRSEPIELSPFIYKSISGIISHIMFGHDVAKESKSFRALITEMTTSTRTHLLAAILMFAPFMRHFPTFSRVWKRSYSINTRFKAEVQKEVNEHEMSRDPNDPRDFLDSFLNEMEKADAVPDDNNAKVGNAEWEEISSEETEVFDYSKDWKRYSSFTFDQLLGMGRDLFLAGTETTSASVLWIILFLTKYSDVQKKMQEEIDYILGPNGIPRMSMLSKFPYVRAVIQEVTRVRPVAPLNVPHKASRDATLMGYRIPKDAIILTNIWAIHHDPTRWAKPDQFRPERHLDESGKFIKSTDWMNFSVGTRSCLGQQLATVEMFIATVMLFRRFKFEFPPGYEPDMDGENLISLRPLHYQVVVEQR